jgi:hypothetical protein
MITSRAIGSHHRGRRHAGHGEILVTKATASRPPEVAGHSQEAGRTVSVTAPTRAVRARPWILRVQEPGVHGRIADGGGPESRLEARMFWSAAPSLGWRSVL